MYTLTFQRSKSKHFQKALNHVHNMGGSWDGEIARLEIPEEKLLEAYEEMGFLFGYVQNWKSLRATFMGKEVQPYRFIFLVWRNVSTCREERKGSKDPRHCWSGVDSKGWGCKQLQRIQRYAHGTAHYKTSNRYWYNFGDFVDKDTWQVYKPWILQKLQSEIDEKAIYLCPFFKMKAVERAVASLPDFIKPDGVTYVNYSTHEYIDGVKRALPVNIRHVQPRKKMSTLQDIINNDPWNYLIN